MGLDKKAVTWFVIGAASWWAFHAFVRPLPTQKQTG